MKKFEKLMYPILLLMLAWAHTWAHINSHTLNEDLMHDNGIFNRLIFLSILFTSLMCFYRASILRPFRGDVFSLSMFFQGVLFFVFAMDEISWFQEILGYQVPQFFLTYNAKKEVNFHHLIFFGYHINNIIFTLAVKIIATLYFFILPSAYVRSKRVKSFVNQFAVPVPKLFHLVSFLLLAPTAFALDSEYNYVIFQLGFYWIVVLMMYNPMNGEYFSRRRNFN